MALRHVSRHYLDRTLRRSPDTVRAPRVAGAGRRDGPDGDRVADNSAGTSCPREATREQLIRVHSAEYLRLINETAGVSVALDADTYTSPDTFEIARLVCWRSH